MPLPIIAISTVSRWELTRVVDTQVIIKKIDGVLEVYSSDQELICTHRIPSNIGQLIANTNHKRDTSKSLDQMMLLVTSYFTDKDMAIQYLQKINQKLPRYIRDHLQVILNALDGSEKQAADSALDFA